MEADKWLKSVRLPNDNHVLENAVMIQTSQRWPLLVDPFCVMESWLIRLFDQQKEVQVRKSDTSKRVMHKMQGNIRWIEFDLIQRTFANQL